MNRIKLASEYSDNDKARGLLESLRWQDAAICPHCKFNEAYKITPKPGSTTRKGLYTCAACRRQFTVTVGTIFEDSHTPISKWLMAILILCSSKKSINAHQLHRMVGITYKSAWFVAHRIRFAMGPKMPLGKLLKGTTGSDTVRRKPIIEKQKQGRAKPLSLKGVRFEDALRGMLNTPKP